jgi:hypothetical protein
MGGGVDDGEARVEVHGVAGVEGLGEEEDDDDGAETDERDGDVVHYAPGIVNGNETIDDETGRDTEGEETGIDSGMSVSSYRMGKGFFWGRGVYAMTDPRSCKNQISEIVKGARHSPDPAKNPRTIRAPSSDPYEVATPAQIEHAV